MSRDQPSRLDCLGSTELCLRFRCSGTTLYSSSLQAPGCTGALRLPCHGHAANVKRLAQHPIHVPATRFSGAIASTDSDSEDPGPGRSRLPVTVLSRGGCRTVRWDSDSLAVDEESRWPTAGPARLGRLRFVEGSTRLDWLG